MPVEEVTKNVRKGRSSARLVYCRMAIAAALLFLSACGRNDLPTQAPSGSQPPVNNEIERRQQATLETMEVAKAVMVTVELDFGRKAPPIAEALGEIERRYKPDDGLGRTFAILDAYGEPTPDGKLHISMHVSSEKPGLASLVFRRTGEVLWQTRIVSRSTPVPAKSLLILVDNGRGGTFTVDGSTNPSSVLEARAKELGVLVRDAWPEGTEREVTFIYSACGCPVKVMVRRVGDRTVRTKELPVMYPDDPSAVQVISRLMRW